MTYVDRLAEMRAGPPALTWLREQQHPTLEQAWAACERGDWMMWLAARCEPVCSSAPWSDERRPLVRAAVACARLALPAFEAHHPGDNRVRDCLDTTARWCEGLATAEEVMRARETAAAAAAFATIAAAFATIAAAFATIAAANAAVAAADAANAAANATTAADAADAAADAADATTAADAAADAADANAANAAANATTAADAYARVQRECADLVRQHLACPVLP
jgi:hypothetical protein